MLTRGNWNKVSDQHRQKFLRGFSEALRSPYKQFGPEYEEKTKELSKIDLEASQKLSEARVKKLVLGRENLG